MKSKRCSPRVTGAGTAFALLATCVPVCMSYGGAAPAQQAAPQQVAPAPKHVEAFAAFEARVKEYVAMRERIEEGLPKLK